MWKFYSKPKTKFLTHLKKINLEKSLKGKNIDKKIIREEIFNNIKKRKLLESYIHIEVKKSRNIFLAGGKRLRQRRSAIKKINKWGTRFGEEKNACGSHNRPQHDCLFQETFLGAGNKRPRQLRRATKCLIFQTRILFMKKTPAVAATGHKMHICPCLRSPNSTVS